MNATLAMRRILSLTVLLATGAAQAMATACPMGIAGGGDPHPIVNSGTPHVAAHDDAAQAGHDAVAQAGHADHTRYAGGAEDRARYVSMPSPHAPLDTGASCALTMSCAPLMPAPNVPLGILGHDAHVASPAISRHLLSADINATTPPPRPLA